MTFHMLWVIALGLFMDAFAVSISKGLAMRAFRWKQALAIACCFGLFQGSCRQSAMLSGYNLVR